MLSIIVAFDQKHGMGFAGKMPWHFSEDLKYFKKTTQGHTVLMGRKTFDSISKALPNRHNIVATTQPQLLANKPNIEIITSPNEFFLQYVETPEEIFVIGGAEIYRLALPYVKKLYITKIAGTYRADTFFPEFDFTAFALKSAYQQDQLTFCLYERREK